MASYYPGNPTEIGYKLLTQRAFSPFRVTPNSAGMDLFSPITVFVKARSSTYINLGVQFQIPQGYYGKIEAKSSLALHYGIQTGAGVIDQDYTGNICIVLFNHSSQDYKINRGDAIAQLIIQPCATLTPVRYQVLPTGHRTRGFGAMDYALRPGVNQHITRTIPTRPPPPRSVAVPHTVQDQVVPTVMPSVICQSSDNTIYTLATNHS